MAYDELIAKITLAGSLLSCFATSCVLLCYIIYRDQQRSFRHALVLNLALADFVNALNNSVSGIIFVRTHELKASPACAMNGLIGQLSVQAVDFSILAIALVTLLSITRKTFLPNASKMSKAFICISVWIVPIVSSTTAKAMGAMVPTGGNWCWISVTRTDLRYGLAHGWRIAIILIVITIYIYVGSYMGRHFSSLTSMRTASSAPLSTGATSTFRKRRDKGFEVMEDEMIELDHLPRPVVAASPLASPMGRNSHLRIGSSENWPFKSVKLKTSHVGNQCNLSVQGASERVTQSSPLPSNAPAWWVSSSPLLGQGLTHPVNQPLAPSIIQGQVKIKENINPTTTTEKETLQTLRQVEREIKLMLWLNAYPIMYVILWIPGIVNRLMEASGHPSSSRVLAALQSSSQFVGFANSLTYGFNQHMRKRIKGGLQDLRSKGRSREEHV